MEFPPNVWIIKMFIMKNLKQMALLAALLIMSWQAAAQRPVITIDNPEYLFLPMQDSVWIKWVPEAYGFGGGTRFFGDAYRPHHGVWVYGVAMATIDMERYPYYWVYMLQDRLVDSANHCYELDTVASELFCFMNQPPVSYADFRFVSTFGVYDTFVIPCYEYYFRDPVWVPDDTRFYVGVSHSPLNALCRPFLLHKTPTFTCHKRGYLSQDPYCVKTWDGLDSVWGLHMGAVLGNRIDWTCDKCYAIPNQGGVYNKYHAWGFFPIVRPPKDSAQIFPPHVHPLKAEAVENFRLTGLDSVHATFSWDTFPPSDWGSVGVNVVAYEVNWAPYTEEYSEMDTLMATDGSCTLFMDFDTTVMYKARCRGLSYHACDIHRSALVAGDWSEEVLFHTGIGEPDTVLLDRMCRRVDGLRYEGLYGGYAKFAWERCEWQTRFEVEYAPKGSSSWRSVATTSMTSYVLLQDLDPSRHYWLRVRALCDHHCHIHDTLLMGAWSDTLEFCLTPEGVDEAVQAVAQGLFSMAPNPARGVVTVNPTAGEGEYPAVLTVNDAKGNEVMRRTFASGSPQTLDLSKLPSSSYLVTLTTRSRRTETQRLVLE